MPWNGWSAATVRNASASGKTLPSPNPSSRDYQASLGKPFLHEAYLAELTELRDQLKASLSASAHDANDDKSLGAAELAERIKVLKAGNTVEASPQRTSQKQASAEEPVTARIRRRTETQPVMAQAVERGAELPPMPDDSIALPMTFQDRIALERQRQDEGPDMP